MAAASANKPGIGGRRYRNSGTFGSPTWAAQLKDLDVTCSFPWDFLEAGSRATRAKMYMKGRGDLSFAIKAIADDADAGSLAILAAAMSPTLTLDCLILNGLITTEGASGFRGEFLVNLTAEAQEADGSIYDMYELKPTPTVNAAGPSSVIMGAASAPTMTAI